MTGSLNFSKFSSLIRKVEKRAYRLVKYYSQIISRSKWLRGKIKTLFHRSLGGGGGGGGRDLRSGNCKLGYPVAR